MNKRLSIAEIEPEAFKAMYALVNYLATTKVSKSHINLLKIRASQINGCAYCLDMHTKEALKNGESNQRIFLLNAWKETSLFTDEEKVVLAITEEVTLINKHGLSDKTYQQAIELFDENYIAQLIMAIVTINAWNRISISSQTEVPR
ncbi:carboxymuconolactone decarboxylase family protein [Daejeonella lutea]|uniref:Alkylhydroperoxidase AhpD family core domain-containing protein n=1 Tax=Daejeonella lutea TaxID=572036 RepID=A0A1T5DGK0_9SPHI|nr:carboxymuconolactone decarboxylase family protein [Daejeonella lutea]SKB70610.1 alkylhydroperoxidase AhpD family core domain-containing protein [Daejeonella lutea]